MDLSYLLQCKDCKETLKDFLNTYPDKIEKKEVELLTNFALFIEMRRLKNNQKDEVIKPSFEKSIFDFNKTGLIEGSTKVIC